MKSRSRLAKPILSTCFLGDNCVCIGKTIGRHQIFDFEDIHLDICTCQSTPHNHRKFGTNIFSTYIFSKPLKNKLGWFLTKTSICRTVHCLQYILVAVSLIHVGLPHDAALRIFCQEQFRQDATPTTLIPVGLVEHFSVMQAFPHLSMCVSVTEYKPHTES